MHETFFRVVRSAVTTIRAPLLPKYFRKLIVTAGPEQPRQEPVIFEFTDASARSVGIAGTFNDWCPSEQPMQSLGDGRWRCTSDMPAGSYEYRLVVDGAWMQDPGAHDSVPNPFGGRNSVLTVPEMPPPHAPAA
jgi:1,4-alpha-glucan branching enzyme